LKSSRSIGRFGQTLLWAALFCGLFLGLRSYPVPVQGLDSEKLFWSHKRQWPADYTMVLAGDSRVYRGVSPAAMARVLPGMRIANYGFSSVALVPAYLDTAVAKLDPAARERVLVIGVTPFALTPRATGENGFSRVEPVPALELRVLWSLRTYLDACSPVLPKRFRPIFEDAADPTGHGFTLAHEDGWIASDWEPRNPDYALTSYRLNLAGNPVSAAQVADLLAWIRGITRFGVKVLGFRPPTTRAMVALEDALGEFNAPAFTAAFAAAGGTWLEMPADAYQTYDGSHLTAAAAEQFSADLAGRIARELGGAAR
jgi:hypothetical protein